MRTYSQAFRHFLTFHREMDVVLLELIQQTLAEVAAFIEGTQPWIGWRYDNGQANRLRRLASQCHLLQSEAQRKSRG